MDRLPFEILGLIGEKLDISDIISYTQSCKKIYKWREKLVNRYYYRKSISDFKAEYLTLSPINGTHRINFQYKFVRLLRLIIKHGGWCLKFSDFDEDVKISLLRFIEDMRLFYGLKIKDSDYILENLVSIMMGMNIDFSCYRFGLKINYSTKYFVDCKYKPWVVNVLCSGNKEIVKQYWRNYYSYKLNKLRFKYSNNLTQKHFELLCECKYILSNFYYQKLMTLKLSRKHWTQLFIQDYKSKTKCNCCNNIHTIQKEHCLNSFFSTRQQIIDYYKEMPIFKSTINRKLRITI